MNTALNAPLDTHDTRILAELQADARLSMAELGRRVHLSQPAVTERVRKLETAGVISGYRATVNLDKLGYAIRAMVRVGRADYARVVKLVQQTPECVNAYNLTGEDSWLLEIAVMDVSHLDAVVSKFCLLTETATSIILNVEREHQPMLPPQRPDAKGPARRKALSARPAR
ncbi:MAG TPA: Lrp/AsnC family transcriptional regulator [Variovorax sp.]|nr:Lrp/AsnC family transcriptional regulator [Variovorax sp.]